MYTIKWKCCFFQQLLKHSADFNSFLIELSAQTHLEQGDFFFSFYIRTVNHKSVPYKNVFESFILDS